jgi:NAD(P)-dependent dehydrogenase (short-subunit alcohol dehydrogenase family)
MSLHPALSRDRVAVITGAASGIGLAAAVKLADLGLKLCLADIEPAALERAAAMIAARAARAQDIHTLVARFNQFERI